MRPNLAALVALAAPLLTAACLALGAQAAEWSGRDWWFETRPRNAAEAAALGRAADLVRLLRGGDHPEQIFPVRAGIIGESVAWLSVIEAATWTEGAAMIRLLEREGAVMTDSHRRRLACLARDLERQSTADYLLPREETACVAGATLAALRASYGPVITRKPEAGYDDYTAAATPIDGRGLVRRGAVGSVVSEFRNRRISRETFLASSHSSR